MTQQIDPQLAELMSLSHVTNTHEHQAQRLAQSITRRLAAAPAVDGSVTISREDAEFAADGLENLAGWIEEQRQIDGREERQCAERIRAALAGGPADGEGTSNG